MSILALTAAAAPRSRGANPYGLLQALQQGGVIAWSVFIILVGMSIFSFYILFTKLMQQQKIISQGRKVRASFWNSPNLREACHQARDERSAYRAIVDDALIAQEQHGKLTDPVDQHDWIATAPGALAGRDRRASRRRPRLPRDGRLDRAVHRSVRYRHRHLPRADQDRRVGSGLDRHRRRPGR